MHSILLNQVNGFDIRIGNGNPYPFNIHFNMFLINKKYEIYMIKYSFFSIFLCFPTRQSSSTPSCAYPENQTAVYSSKTEHCNILKAYTISAQQQNICKNDRWLHIVYLYLHVQKYLVKLDNIRPRLCYLVYLVKTHMAYWYMGAAKAHFI